MKDFLTKQIPDDDMIFGCNSAAILGRSLAEMINPTKSAWSSSANQSRMCGDTEVRTLILMLYREIRRSLICLYLYNYSIVLGTVQMVRSLSATVFSKILRLQRTEVVVTTASKSYCAESRLDA